MKFNIQIIFFKWLALCFAILVSTGSNQAFAQVKASMSQESYYQGDLITLKDTGLPKVIMPLVNQHSLTASSSLTKSQINYPLDALVETVTVSYFHAESA